MIACISPGSTSADHSINTLRYADRLKENKPTNEKNEKKLLEKNILDEIDNKLDNNKPN